MINFLMIFGFLIFFVGTIGCFIITIVMAIKKNKKLWISAVGIPISLVVGFVVLGIGGYLYGQTDEYKESVARKEAEKKENEMQKETESVEQEVLNTEENVDTKKYESKTAEMSIEETEKDYEQELRNFFGDCGFQFVESNYLYENSEYYSQEIVVTVLSVNDTSGKTLYTHLDGNGDLAVYCRFDRKKEIKKLSEGDLVCVAGRVQEKQKTGKVVELENCHILARENDILEWKDAISQKAEDQSEFVSTKREEKIKEIVQMEDKYKVNFYNACASCGIDIFKIKSYGKLKDWENGERYSFEYNGNTHNVYLLDSGEVESINYCQNTSIKLYEKGYEPLNIEDFSIDVGTLTILQGAAENVVKQSLNYPSSANFDWWTTGSYSRIYDYYVLRAELSAKNAFGMKDRHSFRIDCIYSEENGSSLVYYEFDGVSQVGEPNMPEIIKAPIDNP